MWDIGIIGNYMNSLKPIRLHSLNTQALFLLKDLKSGTAKSINAAERFLNLPSFSHKTVDWMINHADTVKLKYAYQLLAIEHGFNSWTELKRYVIDNDCLYRSSCVAYVYAWFKDYQQAETYHRKNGGYLITIWKDYAVCGKEYINCIGLTMHQELWEKIGNNWANPLNKKAWLLLKEQAGENYLKHN